MSKEAEKAIAQIRDNLRKLGWDTLIYPTEEHRVVCGRLLIGTKPWIEAVSEYSARLDPATGLLKSQLPESPDLDPDSLDFLPTS